MEKLFIYGTLAPGRVNEHKLSDISGTWQKATIKGRLYEEGWGADMGYPGIILDNQADEVEGFILSSKELYKKWEELDSFEGDEYKRIIANASLLDGQNIEVNIYVLNK